MNRHRLTGATLALMLVVSSASAQSAKQAISAADAEKLHAMAAAGGVTLDFKGLDLEAAIRLIKTSRAKSPDALLKAHIARVAARDDSIAKLNDALRSLMAIANRLPSDARADAVTTRYASASDTAAWHQAARDAGITPAGIATKADVYHQVTSIRDRKEALSALQQQDMLALQSLTNKRNEAFDLMSSFMKKMQDKNRNPTGIIKSP